MIFKEIINRGHEQISYFHDPNLTLFKNDSELIQNEVEHQNINSGIGQTLKNIPLQKQFRTPKAISQNL